MKQLYELKIAQNEKLISSNVFFTKPNGKSTQPNKQVVLADIKCTRSNGN